MIPNKIYLQYYVEEGFRFYILIHSLLLCVLDGGELMQGGCGCLTWPLFDAPWCIRGVAAYSCQGQLMNAGVRLTGSPQCPQVS